MTIKLLFGGSPCTYWSIAKTNGRETKAEGQGWELFKNYLIAKEKFKPDFFLYENNWSAAKAIKDQIQEELGCKLMRINSALVSAQKRDRFYVFNWDVEQPEDRGILLKDIIESGQGYNPYHNGKSRVLTASYYKAAENLNSEYGSEKHRPKVAELVGEDLTRQKKAYCLTAHYQGAIPSNTIERKQRTMIAEPIRVGTMPKNDGELTSSQANRIYSEDGKSVSLKANGGGWGAKTGLYAQEARGVGYRNRRDEEGELVRRFEGGAKEKANCLTTVQTDSMVAELLNATKNGKAQCVRASSYKDGIRNLVGNNVDKRTCVAIPCRMVGRRKDENGKRCDYNENIPLQQQIEVNKDGNKTNCLTTVQKDNVIAIPREKDNGNTVYTVENGQIDIKGKKYPIKLKDGHYTIRKLTPVECERLQTMPDNYTACVSNTQRYKGLGNGWTAEVIIHILNGVLKDVPRDEKIIVLSMYDGIGTGRYCLDKMGFTNIEYHAFEIDKFAKQVAMDNYPDIIQHGDAFQIRKWVVK